MARLLLIALLAVSLTAIGCSKSKDDIREIEKEASKDDTGQVMDSLQGESQTQEGQQAAAQVGETGQAENQSSQTQEQTSPSGAPVQEAATAVPSEVSQGRQSEASAIGDVKAGEFTVVVGSYAERKYAEAASQKFLAQQYPAFVRETEIGDKTYYRLCIGSYGTIAEAKKTADEIKDRFSLEYWIDQGK